MTRKGDHSPPTSAEVKNAWNYTSTPQYVFMVWCLVKHRDFTFFTFRMNVNWNWRERNRWRPGRGLFKGASLTFTWCNWGKAPKNPTQDSQFQDVFQTDAILPANSVLYSLSIIYYSRSCSRSHKPQLYVRVTSIRLNKRTRVYPKVSGLGRDQNIRLQQQTLVEKQHKGLWRQNSLDWLTK
jgi:hypothetical protein